MSLFKGFRKKSGELDVEEMSEILEFLLLPGEVIRQAYQCGPDIAVFTDKRLLTADAQGADKKRTEFASYPYRSILFFEKHVLGRAEIRLSIYLAGRDEPVQLTCDDDVTAVDMYRLLSRQVLR